jgi:orotidine-5'-phosphate decarboxylase
LKTKILAVTILTSMDDNETYEIFEDNVKYNILKLAKLSIEA